MLVNTKFHRWIKYLSVLMAMIIGFTTSSLPQYSAVEFEYHLISDRDKKFYMLQNNISEFYLYEIKEDGNITTLSHEKMGMSDLCGSGKEILIYNIDDRYVNILKYTNGSIRNSILEDISLKNNCLVSDSSDKIYAVDSSTPSVIITYNQYGDVINRLDAGSDISQLFLGWVSGKPYAVCSDGVVNISDGYVIDCDVPVAPLNFNKDFSTDSMGCVFEFDDAYGFSKITDTHNSCAAVIDGTVYVANGVKIQQLDSSSNVLAEYVLGKNIDRICASGNRLGVLSNNNVFLVSAADFSPLKTEHEEKADDGSSENYDISSDTYRLENGMIMNIPPGTTVAQLRNHLSYGSNAVSFTNHHQQMVTQGQIGTGWTVTFSGNGQSENYQTVIFGDLTGEGNINTLDTREGMDILLGSKSCDEVHFAALDMNFDGQITSCDIWYMMQIKKYRRKIVK